MAEKNTSGLVEDIVNLVLSGDRRTTALNLRTLLFNHLDSMPNNIDGGLVFQNELGYNNTYRPTSAGAFATVDMIGSSSPDKPIESQYWKSDIPLPDGFYHVFRKYCDSSGELQTEDLGPI